MREHVAKKDISLEIIRIIAIFWVLFTHTGTIGSKLYTTLIPKGGYYWFCLSLDTIRMICVPLFLMISGALLLEKDETLTDLFRKRIGRFLLVLLFFSLIQTVWQNNANPDSAIEIRDFLIGLYKGTLKGEYWYLYLFISYLLLSPFLRLIAKHMNKKLMIYMLVLSTGVDIVALIQYENNSLYCIAYNYISAINNYAILFPILGNIIYKISKEKKKRYEFWIWSFCFWIVVFVCSYLVHREYMLTGTYTEAHIWRFTGLLSASVFAIILSVVNKIQVTNKWKVVVCYISDCCFGIYLCENILEHYTRRIYNVVKNITGFDLLSCFVYIICTIIFGTVIWRILKKIPYIGKFI